MVDIHQKIKIKQLEYVNKSLLLGFFSSLLLSTICLITLMDFIPSWLTITLSLMSVFIFSFRLYLFILDKKKPPSEDSIERWILYSFINAVLAAILFSSYGVLTILITNPASVLIIFITIAGLSAGATTAYSGLKYLSMTFLLPVLIPLTIVSFLKFESAYYFIGFMTFLFTFFMYKISIQTYESLYSTLKQAFIIEDLPIQTNESNKREKIKRDFFASMSHEIRTPLNGIVGLLDLLNNSPLNEVQKDYINTIEHSSQDLLNVINDVLDLSKFESGKFNINKAEFNLTSLIKNTETLFKGKLIENKNEFKIIIDKNIPETLIGDKVRITQILNNLVSNATKFTKNGVIKLHVQRGSSAELVHFELSDTGIGIEKNKLPYVFSKYDQIEQPQNNKNLVTEKGTGLGLSICKKLVDLMDGDIGVESLKGKGSIFWFSIPLRSGNNNLSENINENKIDNNFNLKILLIDDRETNLKVSKLLLESMGCTVITGTNGIEAISIASLNKDIDLILMDIQMPIMDGITASKKLKTDGSKIPIIALSAQLESNLDEPYEESGFQGYLTKPINRNDLKEILNKYRKK